eukprot:16088569-Heterocapsa_arctica.AAC.1
MNPHLGDYQKFTGVIKEAFKANFSASPKAEKNPYALTKKKKKKTFKANLSHYLVEEKTRSGA